MKSWYAILEVSESASAEQIRSAYLKMAREYHPDRVPEHLTKLRADAEDKFKQVQEAWTVLGNPARRRLYDLAGRRQDVPSAPTPSQPTHASVARKGTLDPLRHRQSVVKWMLLVLIATLVLVVIGEVAISRESANNPDTTTAEITKPAKKGAGDSYEFNVPPRHIQTWNGEGGKGLEIQLVSATARFDELEVTFRVRTGDHSNLLLYEPPGMSGRTRKILGREVMVDRDFGELYVEDNTEAKYVSTSGFMGGQQTNFNLYNFTRRINFMPHEVIMLSAKFPPVARRASSITFVSPALGKWQPEWRWPAISLK
jgi:curved DNA-binding protein CbpA